MKNYLICLPLLFLTSCATITRGVHEKLYVNSDPSGANVKLSTGENGVTPAKFVKSRRGESFTVTVSKAGYIPQTVRVESKFSSTGGTAMVGGLLAGGVISGGIDAASGAYNSLYPNPVSANLVPTGKAGKRARSEPAIELAPAPPKKTSSPKPKPTPKPKSTPKPTPSPTPSRSFRPR